MTPQTTLAKYDRTPGIPVAARCYRRYRLQGWNRDAARALASRDADTLATSLALFLIVEGRKS